MEKQNKGQTTMLTLYLLLTMSGLVVYSVAELGVGFTKHILLLPVRLGVRTVAEAISSMWRLRYEYIRLSFWFGIIVMYVLMIFTAVALFTAIYILPLISLLSNYIFDHIKIVSRAEQKLDLMIKNAVIRLARLGKIVRAILYALIYTFYWPLWVGYFSVFRLLFVIHLALPVYMVISAYNIITLKREVKIALDPEKDAKVLHLLARVPPLGTNYKEEVEKYLAKSAAI